MPKSSMPSQTVHPTDPSPQDKGDRRTRRTKSRRGAGFFVWLFRLLLLGIGGSVAAVIGMMVAQLYPAPEQSDVPLVERVVSGTQSLWGNVQQFPRALQANFEKLTETRLANTTSTPEPSRSSDSLDRPGSKDASQQAAKPIDLSNLSPVDRQKLNQEVLRMQQQLRELDDHVTAVESRVGKPNPKLNPNDVPNHPTPSLESRLDALEQQLDLSLNRSQNRSSSNNSLENSSNNSPGNPPSNSSKTPTSPVALNSSVSSEMKVTLPTDALFDPDQRTLRAEGTLLLDSVLDNLASDLQRYPRATIQVIAHTDGQDTPERDRAQTLAQARAIEQYLSQSLTQKPPHSLPQKTSQDYKWSAIGHGHDQPLAKDASPEARQRNRRIEVVIRPQP